MEKEVCDAFLIKNGYLFETILVKTNKDCCHHLDNIEKNEMVYEVKIAYKKDERPEWSESVPDADDVEEYKYDYVLSALIRDKISNFLLYS